MIDVIICPGYQNFCADKKILDKIEELGYELKDGSNSFIFYTGNMDILLRTNKKLISWIKEMYVGNDAELFEYEYQGTSIDNGYIIIVAVDESRPWTIAEGTDGSGEYIQYLDYEVINEELNYCKLEQ
jgi:hypothetical protein